MVGVLAMSCFVAVAVFVGSGLMLVGVFATTVFGVVGVFDRVTAVAVGGLVVSAHRTIDVVIGLACAVSGGTVGWLPSHCCICAA